MARPPKYSPEVVKRICDAVAIGATYDLAAKYGGLTYDTLNEWRKTKPQFSEALQEAEGRAAVGWLAKIERAANEGSWQAAAWKLERRYPQEYGRTVQDQRVQHSGTITQEHTGEVTIAAVDYRHAIRALRPPPEALPAPPQEEEDAG